MTTLLLALSYPLLLIGRLIDRVGGRDPLRLRRPAEASLWVVRSQDATDSNYFSETSPAEAGHTDSLAALLAQVARMHAPPRSQPKEKYAIGADRQPGIPDEMYTLW